METCWERKWRGIVKEWEELFSERERGSSVCVFSRLGLLNLCWKQYQLQQFPKKCVCGLHNIISLFEEAYYFSLSSQMNPVCELGISNMLLQLSVKLDRQIGVKEDQRLDFNSDLGLPPAGELRRWNKFKTEIWFQSDITRAYNEPVYLHMNVTARSFWYVNASKSFFLSKCCRQINRRLSAEQLEMYFCVCVCLCLRVLFPNTHMRATSCCLLTADNAVEIDDS